MVKALSCYSLRGMRVLLRVDFNVPIVRGRVAGDFRVRAHLPAIRSLLLGENRIILLSHHSDRRQSIRPLAKHLGTLLKIPVAFLSDPSAAALPPGPIVLVENLRFWNGEEAEDGTFARILPSSLGPLFEREIAELKRLEKNPQRPLVAVFGGAKIETKVKLLKRMVRLADRVLVGGALANPFLRARGATVSLPSTKDAAARAAITALARSPKIVLPVDGVMGRSPGARQRTGSLDRVQQGEGIYDAGPATVRLFGRELAQSRTIIWNGPLGIVE